MSSNLHQAGVKLLRLLGRNAELVMDAYLSGSLDETRQEPALLKKLTDNGILWRPEPDEPLRLSRNVRALLEEGLKDERNRQINANVGSAWLPSRPWPITTVRHAPVWITAPPRPTWRT